MTGKSILLIEDNPDDEALTLRAFKKNNISNEVIVVRDGVEALEFLLGPGGHGGRSADALPGVILLDLKLPRIDGLEVLKKLREDEYTRYLPVVVLTSSKEDQDIVSSYALGANSYIRKPVEFEKFVDAIGQVGRYWLTLNEGVPNRKT